MWIKIKRWWRSRPEGRTIDANPIPKWIVDWDETFPHTATNTVKHGQQWRDYYAGVGPKPEKRDE